MDIKKIKTIGIFSKLGMPGGSENRVTQLANAFSKQLTTYIFAQEKFSDKLKHQLDSNVILRENSVHCKKTIYELQGVDLLLVVNSDSYSFTKPSFWDGTQGKHHSNKIDISLIPRIGFLFNYVVSPAQALFDLYKINPNIKILTASQWFKDNIEKEDKFKKLRTLGLPILVVESPVSSSFLCKKSQSTKIRINRHSMAFAYKHDFGNLDVVQKLCKKYDDKISFTWMGVPSHVASLEDKEIKLPYREKLEILPQMTILEPYSVEVPNLLQETDILFFYISRTRKEPWPRTIAEGMMAGCCCVTNKSYGMTEQIEHGKTGYLFDDKNPNEAFKQLSKLIENPQKIKEVGDTAQQYAKKHFLDEEIIKKMLEFLV